MAVTYRGNQSVFPPQVLEGGRGHVQQENICRTYLRTKRCTFPNCRFLHPPLDEKAPSQHNYARGPRYNPGFYPNRAQDYQYGHNRHLQNRHPDYRNRGCEFTQDGLAYSHTRPAQRQGETPSRSNYVSTQPNLHSQQPTSEPNCPLPLNSGRESGYPPADTSNLCQPPIYTPQQKIFSNSPDSNPLQQDFSYQLEHIRSHEKYLKNFQRPKGPSSGDMEQSPTHQPQATKHIESVSLDSSPLRATPQTNQSQPPVTSEQTEALNSSIPPQLLPDDTANPNRSPADTAAAAQLTLEDVQDLGKKHFLSMLLRSQPVEDPLSAPMDGPQDALQIPCHPSPNESNSTEETGKNGESVLLFAKREDVSRLPDLETILPPHRRKEYAASGYAQSLQSDPETAGGNIKLVHANGSPCNSSSSSEESCVKQSSNAVEISSIAKPELVTSSSSSPVKSNREVSRSTSPAIDMKPMIESRDSRVPIAPPLVRRTVRPRPVRTVPSAEPIRASIDEIPVADTSESVSQSNRRSQELPADYKPHDCDNRTVSEAVVSDTTTDCDLSVFFPFMSTRTGPTILTSTQQHPLALYDANSAPVQSEGLSFEQWKVSVICVSSVSGIRLFGQPVSQQVAVKQPQEQPPSETQHMEAILCSPGGLSSEASPKPLSPPLQPTETSGSPDHTAPGSAITPPKEKQTSEPTMKEPTMEEPTVEEPTMENPSTHMQDAEEEDTECSSEASSESDSESSSNESSRAPSPMIEEPAPMPQPPRTTSAPVRYRRQHVFDFTLCWNCWSPKHKCHDCPDPFRNVEEREELRIAKGVHSKSWARFMLSQGREAAILGEITDKDNWTYKIQQVAPLIRPSGRAVTRPLLPELLISSGDSDEDAPTESEPMENSTDSTGWNWDSAPSSSPATTISNDLAQLDFQLELSPEWKLPRSSESSLWDWDEPAKDFTAVRSIAEIADINFSSNNSTSSSTSDTEQPPSSNSENTPPAHSPFSIFNTTETNDANTSKVSTDNDAQALTDAPTNNAVANEAPTTGSSNSCSVSKVNTDDDDAQALTDASTNSAVANETSTTGSSLNSYNTTKLNTDNEDQALTDVSTKYAVANEAPTTRPSSNSPSVSKVNIDNDDQALTDAPTNNAVANEAPTTVSSNSSSVTKVNTDNDDQALTDVSINNVVANEASTTGSSSNSCSTSKVYTNDDDQALTDVSTNNVVASEAPTTGPSSHSYSTRSANIDIYSQTALVCASQVIFVNANLPRTESDDRESSRVGKANRQKRPSNLRRSTSPSPTSFEELPTNTLSTDIATRPNDSSLILGRRPPNGRAPRTLRPRPPRGINKLPMELLHNIINYVGLQGVYFDPRYEDNNERRSEQETKRARNLRNVRQACRSFYEVTQKIIYRFVHLVQPRDLDRFVRVISRREVLAGFVLDLYIDFKQIEPMDNYKLYQTNDRWREPREHHKPRPDNSKGQSKAIAAIFEHCVNLRGLYAHCGGAMRAFNDLDGHYPSVFKLELFDKLDIGKSADNIWRNVQRCPNLEEFSFIRDMENRKADHKTLQIYPSLKNWASYVYRNLALLRLEYASEISDRLLAQMCSQLPELRKIYLTECKLVTAGGLARVIDTMRERITEFSYTSYIDTRGRTTEDEMRKPSCHLCKVLNRCPNLVLLHYSPYRACTELFKGTGWPNLRALAIEMVQFHGCNGEKSATEFTEMYVSQFRAGKFPKLRTQNALFQTNTPNISYR